MSHSLFSECSGLGSVLLLPVRLHHMARRGLAWHGGERRGEARQGKAGQGLRMQWTGQRAALSGAVAPHEAGRVWARLGMAWRGEAGHGKGAKAHTQE